MGGACLRWTGVAYTQGGLHGKLIGTFRKCRSKAGVAYGQVALSTGFTVYENMKSATNCVLLIRALGAHILTTTQFKMQVSLY